MNSFKTKLFKVSFDQNDIKKIVHIEHLKSEEYQSFLELTLLVRHVLELKGDYKLSNKEAIKIISKSANHFFSEI